MTALGELRAATSGNLVAADAAETSAKLLMALNGAVAAAAAEAREIDPSNWQSASLEAVAEGAGPWKVQVHEAADHVGPIFQALDAARNRLNTARRELTEINALSIGAAIRSRDAVPVEGAPNMYWVRRNGGRQLMSTGQAISALREDRARDELNRLRGELAGYTSSAANAANAMPVPQLDPGRSPGPIPPEDDSSNQNSGGGGRGPSGGGSNSGGGVGGPIVDDSGIQPSPVAPAPVPVGPPGATPPPTESPIDPPGGGTPPPSGGGDRPYYPWPSDPNPGGGHIPRPDGPGFTTPGVPTGPDWGIGGTRPTDPRADGAIDISVGGQGGLPGGGSGLGGAAGLVGGAAGVGLGGAAVLGGARGGGAAGGGLAQAMGGAGGIGVPLGSAGGRAPGGLAGAGGFGGEPIPGAAGAGSGAVRGAGGTGAAGGVAGAGGAAGGASGNTTAMGGMGAGGAGGGASNSRRRQPNRYTAPTLEGPEEPGESSGGGAGSRQQWSRDQAQAEARGEFEIDPQEELRL
ncbi:MAG: hypothetical protein LBK95_11680 [Bifidobacteriaceae bacterium]|jgi:hypothetical protein|nr:hypothetical protein [Bifidobacteriaceae bacterium]